jgi:hypothetical protein
VKASFLGSFCDTEEHEYDRARERIREALPLADACGLVNVVAGTSLSCGPRSTWRRGRPRPPQPG